VYLGQHEEVGQTGHAEAERGDENDETHKVIATRRVLVLEGHDGGDQTTAAGAVDAESHEAGEDELTEEDEEEDHKVERGVRTERLVCRPEPAEVGERDEEDGVDQGQTERRAVRVVSAKEEAGTGQEVSQEQQGVEKPEVVEAFDHLLELHGDIHVYILIEAGLEWTEGRYWWPIVHSNVVRGILEFLFSTRQLCGFLLQLLLSPLEVCRGGGLLGGLLVGGGRSLLGRGHHRRAHSTT